MTEQEYFQQFLGVEPGEDSLLNWNTDDNGDMDAVAGSPLGRWWFSVRFRRLTWKLDVRSLPMTATDSGPSFIDTFDSAEDAIAYAEIWLRIHTP